MKHALLAIIVHLACLACLAGHAAAQQIDSPYRFLDDTRQFGVFAGYMSAQEGRAGIGPQPAPTLGARLAFRVSGPFSLGLEVGYTPTQRTVRDTVFQAADSVFRPLGEADMRLISVMGEARFNLTGPRTWHGLQPFVAGGAGVVFDGGDRHAFDEDLPDQGRYRFGTTFAGQVGVGVDWYPTERVSLRLDARNLLWKLRVPDAFLLTEHGQTLSASEWENNFVVTAGLSFHF